MAAETNWEEVIEGVQEEVENSKKATVVESSEQAEKWAEKRRKVVVGRLMGAELGKEKMSEKETKLTFCLNPNPKFKTAKTLKTTK